LFCFRVISKIHYIVKRVKENFITYFVITKVFLWIIKKEIYHSPLCFLFKEKKNNYFFYDFMTSVFLSFFVYYLKIEVCTTFRFTTGKLTFRFSRFRKFITSLIKKKKNCYFVLYSFFYFILFSIYFIIIS
jgi:hypothetical protein